MRKGLLLLIFLLSCFSMFSQVSEGELKKVQTYFDSYTKDKFCLAVQGTLSANRVLVYYVNRDSLLELYNKFYEGALDKKIRIKTVRVELINLDSCKVEYVNQFKENVDLYEFELDGDSLVYTGEDTNYFNISFQHVNDTLYVYKNGKKQGIDLKSGNVFDKITSYRFSWTGGDLDSGTDFITNSSKFSIVCNQYGKINIQILHPTSKSEYENRNYEYKKGYTSVNQFFSFEQNTNLFVNSSSVKEFGSFSFLYGINYQPRIANHLYFDYGIAYQYQNIRLIDNEAYSTVDLANLERRRIRLHSANFQSGFVVTFGKSEDIFMQMLLWGNFIPGKKYSVWGVNGDKYTTNDDFINRFNYGIKLQIGKGLLSVYGNYRLSSLYKKSYGLPEITPFSLGIELQGFETGR